jgi:hypothetical protein
MGLPDATSFFTAYRTNPNMTIDKIPTFMKNNKLQNNPSVFLNKNKTPKTLQEVYMGREAALNSAGESLQTGKWRGKPLSPEILNMINSGKSNNSLSGAMNQIPSNSLFDSGMRQSNKNNRKDTLSKINFVENEPTKPDTNVSTSNAVQMSSLNYDDALIMMSTKIDTMINLLSNSNDAQQKLLMYAQV